MKNSFVTLWRFAPLGCLLFPLTVEATTTIFESNFDAATEVTGSVTDNATDANLNSGTSVGAWSSIGTPNPGAIVSDGGTNNAFLVDQNVSGNVGARPRGTFSSTVDLAAGEGISFSFDIYASRQGNGTRELRFSLDGGTGNADKAYVFMFDMDNTKNFDWINTANATNAGTGNGVGIGGLGATVGTNTGFTNPAVDGHLSWAAGTMIGVNITIPAGSDNTTVAGSTGALATIDWNGDGIINAAQGDVQDVAFGPRQVGIDELSSFEIFYGGSGTRGAWLDNIEVQLLPVPEPSSLVLGGIGFLALLRRRQR